MERWIEAFNRISFTNVRILVTTLLASGTGVAYWIAYSRSFGGATPVDVAIDNNWLIFLAALGGIDVAQYVSKSTRTTKIATNITADGGSAPPADTELTEEQASTDIAELIQQKG